MRDSSIRVVIIDEYPVVRWGIRGILSERALVRVLGDFSSMQDASRLIRLQKPDVVITELVNGGKYMLEEWPSFFFDNSVKALAFTDACNWESVERFLNSGGHGFACKQSSMDDLLSAFQAVVNGRRWVSPCISSPSEASKRNTISSNHVSLTEREIEIISLITKGLTGREIADQLCVSIKTIESHRYRIFKKLNIRSSAQLTRSIERIGIK